MISVATIASAIQPKVVKKHLRKLNSHQHSTYCQLAKDKYSNHEAYKQVVRESQMRELRKTSSLINGGLQGKGFGHLELIKEVYGTPQHSFKINKHLKILIYKINLAGFRFRVEFHLINKHLQYYTFVLSEQSAERKMQLKQYLRRKYLNGERHNLEQFLFVDDRNAAVFVEDNVSLVLHYFPDMNAPFLDYMRHEMHREQLHHRKMRQMAVHQLFEHL